MAAVGLGIYEVHGFYIILLKGPVFPRTKKACICCFKWPHLRYYSSKIHKSIQLKKGGLTANSLYGTININLHQKTPILEENHHKRDFR